MSETTRPAEDRLRFGCCGGMVAPDVDPLGSEIVEDLAALGYEYIELSLRDLVALPEAALTALRTRLQRAGMKCEACNNFFPSEVRLTGPDVDADAALRYAERALATAARFDATVVVLGSSAARNVPSGFPPDLAWAQLRTLLRALAPVAERHRLTIAIEHLHRGESNILNTIAETWRMAQEVAHPRVRLLVDAYHLRMEMESPAILAEVAPAIAHVHVAEHRERRFPTGRDDLLPNFFAALRAAGYVGRCSIEAYSTDFVADAARALCVCRQLSTTAVT